MDDVRWTGTVEKRSLHYHVLRGFKSADGTKSLREIELYDKYGDGQKQIALIWVLMIMGYPVIGDTVEFAVGKTRISFNTRGGATVFAGTRGAVHGGDLLHFERHMVGLTLEEAVKITPLAENIYKTYNENITREWESLDKAQYEDALSPTLFDRWAVGYNKFPKGYKAVAQSGSSVPVLKEMVYIKASTGDIVAIVTGFYVKLWGKDYHGHMPNVFTVAEDHGYAFAKHIHGIEKFTMPKEADQFMIIAFNRCLELFGDPFKEK